MDTVTLDGKTYIKAVKAADGVGYAPDYVGQLCRKGTLDAIILGKTWYVSAESLLAHKNSQTRTNTGITKRDVEKQKNARIAGRSARYAPTSAEIEQRKRLLDTGIRYSKDIDELLPAVAGKSVAVVPDLAIIVPEGEVENPAVSEASEEPSVKEEPLSIDEYENPQDPAIEYPQEEEYVENEETAVPIRKVHDSAPVRMPVKRPFVRAYGVAREESIYGQGSKDPQIPSQRPSRRRSYRLVPIAVLLLIIFLVANLILESTWIYTTSGQKKTSFHTTYHFTSLSSIFSAFTKE